MGEMAGARWADLYEDTEGRIGLRVLHAKGGRERQVKVLPETLAALAAVRVGKNAGSDRLDPKDDSPLLPSPRGGAPYSTWAIWKKTKQMAAKAGIDKNVHPHTWRHSHATWAAAGDADLVSLMRQLGHQKAETSLHYIGIAKALASSAADALPSLN
jgi:integrase